MTRSSTGGVSRRSLLKGAAAAMGTGAFLLDGAVLGAGRAFAAPLGASAIASYLVPTAEGVRTQAIITTGERAENGYRMAGIPDGLGVMRDGNNFTVVMNHEFPASDGIARAHGSKGSFISRWTIDRDMKVTAGRDLIASASSVHLFDSSTQTYSTGTIAWTRFCSGDLPDQNALRYGSVGTDSRIFFNGEETLGGRAWAHLVTGAMEGHTWQLPALGRMAFENVVLCPHSKAKTVALLTDDGALSTAPKFADNPSEVYVYVGTKTDEGTPIDRAGLSNGKLYGIQIRREGVLLKEESDQFGLGTAITGFGGKAHFDLVPLGVDGAVSTFDGQMLEQDAIAKDVFRFQRAEDSAWDPRGGTKYGDAYFVTTASITGNSRLWRLRFDDILQPELGGTIEILLRGNEGHRMLDNMAVDRLGRILLQEDPGNNAWLASIRLYSTETGEYIKVAQHDPAVFESSSSPTFQTLDEESSGIIDASDILGAGWFLAVVQNHKKSSDSELVEAGQLVSLYVPPTLGRKA